MVYNHGKCNRVRGRIQRGRTGFYIKSDEVCICPECKSVLKYRDKVLRYQKLIGGERKLYMINRLQCTKEGCRKLHRQLTDGMIKFKQYAAEVIEDVIDGVISEEDGLKNPCDGSMKHWRWWFLYNEEQMEGYLRSASCRLHGFDTGLVKHMGSLLEEIRENISPGWLGKVCRIVNNLGGALRLSPEYG